MGYSAHAKLVYGVESTENEISHETKVRSCEHSIDLTAKFCQECGKPVYKSVIMHPEELVEIWKEKNPLQDFGISKDFEFEFHRLSCESKSGVLGFSPRYRSSNNTVNTVFTPTQEMTKYIIKFFEDHNLKTQHPNIKQVYFLYESY